MNKIAIVYRSETENTKAMKEAVLEGSTQGDVPAASEFNARMTGE